MSTTEATRERLQTVSLPALTGGQTALVAGKAADSCSTILARSLDPSLSETSGLPAALHAELGVAAGSTLVFFITIALTAAAVELLVGLNASISRWTGAPDWSRSLRLWSYVFAGVAYGWFALSNMVIFVT